MSEPSEQPGNAGIRKKVDESWKESVKKENEAPADKQQPLLNEEAMPPEPNFTFFVSSLGMQAMMAMGELPDPRTQTAAKTDMAQAQYIIEVLRMLAEKTKKNLSSEEDELLKNLLYELQVKFVQKTQGTQR
jgi:hypothetical protein